MSKSFKIANSDGVVRDLMLDSLLLHDLNGYGFTTDVKFQGFRNNFIVTEKTMGQTKIKGSVLFQGDNSYYQYREFATFINMSPLTVMYQPENVEYSMRAICTSLSKTELGNNYIRATVELTGLERFAEPLNYKSSDTTVLNTNDSKTYNYTYGYTYAQGRESNTSATFDIVSSLDCPVELKIYGIVKNPRWSHYVNGVKVAEGKCNVDVNESELFTMSTFNDSLQLTVTDINTGDIVSVYDKSDFKTDRFIWFKRGHNVITVSDDIGGTLKFELAVKQYYASV